MRYLLIGAALLITTGASAHPDGATPYWYPATFVYGFIEGCWDTIEQSRAPITADMWPAQIKLVCGCVVDALRHSIPFHEIDDQYNDPKVQLIVNATLPVCIDEESNG